MARLWGTVLVVKLLLAFGVAALCASAAVVALFIWKPAPSSWQAQVERCRPLGGEEALPAEERRTFDCIQRVVLDAAQADQVAAVAGEITSVAAVDNRFYSICHEAMHTLGPQLIDFYGSATEAVGKVNTIDCGNGLAHGVLDAWADLDSTGLDDFPSMVASCERANLSSSGGCAEGIGHAAFQHQDPGADRLPIAFGLCELFTSRDLGFSCAYGVIMQPYFKQNPEVIREAPLDFPAGDGLVRLCSAQELSDAVREGCYAGAGWMMALELVLKEDSLPGAESAEYVVELGRRLSYCKAAPGAIERTLCEDFFFSRLPISWYRPVAQLEGRCASLSAIVGRSFLPRCLAGAYEFTPPAQMLDLARRYPPVAELVRPRWELERGPFPGL